MFKHLYAHHRVIILFPESGTPVPSNLVILSLEGKFGIDGETFVPVLPIFVKL
jgi:hypothetical protein